MREVRRSEMSKCNKFVEIDGEKCPVTKINGIEYIDIEMPTRIIEQLKESVLRLFGIEIIN